MENRSDSLMLPLTEREKEFIIDCAEKACLSISDFVLLSALAINLPERINPLEAENIQRK